MMPNNPQALLAQFRGFAQNPAQMLLQQRIPQQYVNDPDGAIQYLLDSGRISQQQYNLAQQYMRQLSAQKG